MAGFACSSEVGKLPKLDAAFGFVQWLDVLKLPRLFAYPLTAKIADALVAIPDSAPSILREMDEAICLDARLMP